LRLGERRSRLARPRTSDERPSPGQRARRPLAGVGALQIGAAVGAVGLALVLALIALLPQKTRLAGTNSVGPQAFVTRLNPGRALCQTNVLIPKDSAGVRLLVGTFGRLGPRLTATIEGRSPSFMRRASIQGYRDGSSPVLAFEPVSETVRADRLCLRVAAGGDVALAGEPDPNADQLSELTVAGSPVAGDLSIQTVRAGKESLAELVPTVFERASRFRPGWVGPWTYWALVALALALVPAAVLLLRRYARGPPRLRTGAAVVAALAFGNALVWSLVVPAFQPPDESAHYAYVESLVERGERPARSIRGGEGSYSRGTSLAINSVAAGVVQDPAARPPWTGLEERELAAQTERLGAAAEQGGGGFTTAAGYSPTYYAIETGPYRAAGDGSVFTRLWLMRVLSALLMAATAALAFAAARELAPSVDWFAPVAGLAVAFQPMLAFIGGAVNNDNLLFLAATLEIYLLARALRRGLTPGLAAAIGAVLGFGIVVKPNMYGLAPVALAVVAWAVWRSGNRRIAGRSAALAGAALALTLAIGYMAFSGDKPLSETVDATTSDDRPFNVREFLSYTWQWYLPALPFMNDMFSGELPVYDIYFRGFWANFGHLDTRFPEGVYQVLLAVCVAGLGLVGLAVWRARARFSSVLPRLGLGLLTVASLALLVNFRSYLALIESGVPFAQGRYLLPAVALFGAAIAGAALAFGRRAGLAAGTAFVTALACFNAFSLGLVLTRFYV
jgi:hypothetical protein